MPSSKKRVVLFGSRPLAKRVLQFLLQQADVDIIGMVVQQPTPSRYWQEDPGDLDIPRFRDEAEVLTVQPDLGISVNYWRIIKEPLLSHPPLGFVNVHHSYNLRIRGRNCATHAILRAREDNIWHHGSTLHYMTKDLDAGPIVASCACVILEEDTALSLFQRVEDASFEMLKVWLPRLWRERVIPYDPPSEFHTWRRQSIDEKEVSMEMSDLDIYDRVRAFTFPPFELPYAYVDGNRRYLTTQPHGTTTLLVDAGRNRCVYCVSEQKLQHGVHSD